MQAEIVMLKLELTTDEDLKNLLRSNMRDIEALLAEDELPSPIESS